MGDLKLKCVIKPAGWYWVRAWKYEIFIEGQEDPHAIGYYSGTRAEVEAIAIASQQRFLDEWKQNGRLLRAKRDAT